MKSERQEIAAVREILDGSGLASDGMLIVHGAFRGLSHMGFRAEAFIEALLAAIPQGTLLMPVMTWRAVTIDAPFFDEMDTRSETGILSEVFRTEYATARSIHPTHSAAARGPLAEFMVAGHQYGQTPCPPNSPFGRLSGKDAHILMIGVGLETCTAFHCWEEQVAPDYYIRPLSEAVIYDCRDRHGAVHKVRARRHKRLNRDFPKFGPILDRQGKWRTGEIGQTSWQYCRSRDLQNVVLDALAADPTATVTDIAQPAPLEARVPSVR